MSENEREIDDFGHGKYYADEGEANRALENWARVQADWHAPGSRAMISEVHLIKNHQKLVSPEDGPAKLKNMPMPWRIVFRFPPESGKHCEDRATARAIGPNRSYRGGLITNMGLTDHGEQNDSTGEALGRLYFKSEHCWDDTIFHVPLGWQRGTDDNFSKTEAENKEKIMAQTMRIARKTVSEAPVRPGGWDRPDKYTLAEINGESNMLNEAIGPNRERPGTRTFRLLGQYGEEYLLIFYTQTPPDIRRAALVFESGPRCDEVEIVDHIWIQKTYRENEKTINIYPVNEQDPMIEIPTAPCHPALIHETLPPVTEPMSADDAMRIVDLWNRNKLNIRKGKSTVWIARKEGFRRGHFDPEQQSAGPTTWRMAFIFPPHSKQGTALITCEKEGTAGVFNILNIVLTDHVDGTRTLNIISAGPDAILPIAKPEKE